MNKRFSVASWLDRLCICLLAVSLSRLASAQTNTDPYLWLEQVEGERALQWVRAENAKTLGVLEQDPRYAGLHADALALAEDKDRIPMPEMVAGQIFNFWQDADHVRGILRKTSRQSYDSATPAWTTVLDLDELAKSEKTNWVWQGWNLEEPSEKRAMIMLSDGGGDASTLREFDVVSGSFVKNGFQLPRAKQGVDWEDEDTLLVSRANNPGELTSSGYPYLVRRLKRGQRVEDAPVVFRGDAKDVGDGAAVLHDGTGHSAVLAGRSLTTFESEQYLWTGDQFAKLDLPRKCQIEGLVHGRILVNLKEDWKVNGAEFHQGSLVDLDLAATAQDPGHLHPSLIYAPGPRESLAAAAPTKDALLVTAFDNVRGRAFVFSPEGDGWKRGKLDLPDNSTISVASTDIHSSDAYLGVTGFLQPSSLWSVDTGSQALREVKTLPPKFDASRDVVEQFQAISSDGTPIPYFIVHPKAMALDGNNPTLLNAYGGFQISETPSYQPSTGKLWLERGGVYVLANIRGGGEFGPAWHEAGLKTHRQIIYDDFAAVARDLIARKITTPRRLGIMGGSNGGLLMGVEMTQHPELWHAVVIAVPLLDMERFEQIAAGPSWVGEYGSMSHPAERAFLSSISPYANLRRGVAYPQAFIWTTTKDDRVGPQHARKFAARLAEYGVPYYYYEVIEGGHSAGANLKERARTTALGMIYLTRKLMD